MTAFSFLSSLDLIRLIGLFWYTAILDVPRYTISAIVAVGHRAMVSFSPWHKSVSQI